MPITEKQMRIVLILLHEKHGLSFGDIAKNVNMSSDRSIFYKMYRGVFPKSKKGRSRFGLVKELPLQEMSPEEIRYAFNYRYEIKEVDRGQVSGSGEETADS